MRVNLHLKATHEYSTLANLGLELHSIRFVIGQNLSWDEALRVISMIDAVVRVITKHKNDENFSSLSRR